MQGEKGARADSVSHEINLLNGADQQKRLTVLIPCACLIITCAAYVTSILRSYASQLATAQEEIAAGHSSKAIAELQQIVARAPNTAVAQYLLGDAYFRAGRFKEALQPLTQAVRLQRESAVFRQALAADYFSLRDFGPAIENFKLVVAVNPKNSRAHLGLGMAYVYDGDFGLGIAELKSAIVLTPDSIDCQDALGEAYLLSGRPDLAGTVYQKVLQDHPTDLRAQTGYRVAQARLTTQLESRRRASPD